MTDEQVQCSKRVEINTILSSPVYSLENVEHCGGEPEQAGYYGYMHMNRLSFTLK